MDKTDRLLDAMNNPEKYSSAEIEEMLQDAETKEIFDLLDKTKSSLQPVSTPDIDLEWNKFKDNNHYNRKSAFLSLSAFFCSVTSICPFSLSLFTSSFIA